MNDIILPIHSVFRVRFTFSANGFIYSRVALVCASSTFQAEKKVTDWVLRTTGPLPDFRFKSISRYRDCSYIIPDALISSLEDLPPSDPIESSAVARVRSMTKEELISELGEFIEPDEYNIFFN